MIKVMHQGSIKWCYPRVVHHFGSDTWTYIQANLNPRSWLVDPWQPPVEQITEFNGHITTCALRTACVFHVYCASSLLEDKCVLRYFKLTHNVRLHNCASSLLEDKFVVQLARVDYGIMQRVCVPYTTRPSASWYMGHRRTTLFRIPLAFVGQLI